MLEEHVMLQFLRKFDEYPFLVKMDGKEYLIGEGDPTFTAVSYTHLDVYKRQTPGTILLIMCIFSQP